MTIPTLNPTLEPLVAELTKRVPQPLDCLELAAVAESIGITDAVAREDFGVEDVFALAALVFPSVRNNARRVSTISRNVDGESPEVPPNVGGGAARSLLALAPLLILLLTLSALARSGWTSRSVLAVSLGVTAAMVVTSGPILAVGNRTSRYLGVKYRGAARRYLALSLASIVAGALIVAALSIAALRLAHLLPVHESVLFGGTIAAWSFLWLMIAAAGLVGSPLLPLTALAGGVGVGAAWFARGVWVGLSAGYATTVALVSVGLLYHLLHWTDEGMQLPLPAQLLADAAPYAAYGSAFSLFILEPHVFGWLGSTTLPREDALRVFEAPFTLALPPVLVASALYEKTTRAQWSLISRSKVVQSPLEFKTTLRELRDWQQDNLALVVTALSVVAVVGVEVLKTEGYVGRIDWLVFLSGLVGFFLVGMAQLDCLMMLSLAAPRAALASVSVGLVAMAVTGIPSVVVDFRFAAPGFAIAAGMFAVGAAINCERLLAAADYHYANAF